MLTALPHYMYSVMAEVSISPTSQKVQSSAESERHDAYFTVDSLLFHVTKHCILKHNLLVLEVEGRFTCLSTTDCKAALLNIVFWHRTYNLWLLQLFYQVR